VSVRVYLALGSNLGDRTAMLRAALERLAGAVTLDALSPVYETAPMYVTDQPAFLNMAVGGTTLLTALELLDLAKQAEEEIGRVPSLRNGPRAIDIDLLYYGDAILQLDRLTLPHPRIGERAFVLAPLADIAPDWIGPDDSRPISTRLAAVPGRNSVRWAADAP
jgi:2-amino-4-hydroxy-6-hydroxymethyldihydropteridine diphosphokinase